MFKWLYELKMPTLYLSRLQHYLFCPRQFALIELEDQWAENQLTAEGQLCTSGLIVAKMKPVAISAPSALCHLGIAIWAWRRSRCGRIPSPSRRHSHTLPHRVQTWQTKITPSWWKCNLWPKPYALKICTNAPYQRGHYSMAKLVVVSRGFWPNPARFNPECD